MVLPRFSLFAIVFVATTVFAAIFAIGRQAIFGHAWAIAICVALGGLVTIMLTNALLYIEVRLAGWFVRRVFKGGKRPESPFATDKLPPQIIPPSDPE